MRARLHEFVGKVDSMSLRERILIFAAAAFTLVSMLNAFLLEPLSVQQRRLSALVVQQQEKMKETQAELNEILLAKQSDKISPQRERVSQLREQLAQGENYLNATRDKLVHPEQMARLLEQVLNKNARLQLVELSTLPASPFVEQTDDKTEVKTDDKTPEVLPERQIFKHGVKITVRGSYSDLTQYLAALEGLPTQMFWGMAKMSVVQYPKAELTLILYTLSLDKTWLQV